MQLLKPINSSHNPNPIPNPWLGLSKRSKSFAKQRKAKDPFPIFSIQSTAHSQNTHQSGAICWDLRVSIYTWQSRRARNASCSYWLMLAATSSYWPILPRSTSRGIDGWDQSWKKKCPILYGRKQTNRQTRPCTTVRNSECQLLEGSG